jgi:hypothetical protein
VNDLLPQVSFISCNNSMFILLVVEHPLDTYNILLWSNQRLKYNTHLIPTTFCFGTKKSITSHWKGSVHFMVRLKYNSWSDRQEGNDYFDSDFSLPLEVWRSDHPWWRPDHPRTEDGGLTGHLWQLNHPGTGAGSLTGP